jgi:hypothetical protein
MAEAKKTAGTAKSGEVVKAAISTEELAALNSFEDALALAKMKYGESNVVAASDVIGDGFKLLDNKDQLIGVPFLAVQWDFHEGDHGEFVAMKVMTQDGQKFIVNDGSSGIRDQVMAYTAKTGNYGGLFCLKGLRRSNYTYTDKDTGKESPATTYYLDTSA